MLDKYHRSGKNIGASTCHIQKGVVDIRGSRRACLAIIFSPSAALGGCRYGLD